MTETYRTKAFAERAGVTVRTLHHYDRLGLLKPGHVANSSMVSAARPRVISEPALLPDV